MFIYICHSHPGCPNRKVTADMVILECHNDSVDEYVKSTRGKHEYCYYEFLSFWFLLPQAIEMSDIRYRDRDERGKGGPVDRRERVSQQAVVASCR